MYHWRARPGRGFAHAEDDVNSHILHIFKGSFSLDASCMEIGRLPSQSSTCFVCIPAPAPSPLHLFCVYSTTPPPPPPHHHRFGKYECEEPQSGDATLLTHTPTPYRRHLKKERCGTNKDKTNITHEAIDAQARKKMQQKNEERTVVKLHNLE